MSALPFALTDLLMLVVTAVVSAYVIRELYDRYKGQYKLPPGPRGWPIVGNALQMGTYPYVKMIEWSKTYGNVMLVKAGFFKMVVVNDYDTAHEALVKQGPTFAGRIHSFTGDFFSGGGEDIVLADYGVKWQARRKMASHAMRNFADRGTLERLVRDEIGDVLQDIAGLEGEPTDPKPIISVCVYSVIASILYGSRLERAEISELVKLVDEALDVMGSGLLADYFPSLSWIPTRGKKMMRNVMEYYTAKIKPIIKQHKESFDPENVTGLIDELLKCQKDADDAHTGDAVLDKTLTDDNIFYTMVDLFDAGTNTSIETLTWGIALLATYPDIQRRLAEEITSVLGSEKPPCVSDRARMPYTEATLYEILRFGSFIPMLLPHTTTEDAKLNGYDVPKGTMVLFNAYSMHFDPSFWDEPEKFNPERFIQGGVFVPPSQNFIPFGAGRRVCLGEVIAKQENFLLLAHLVQKFEVRKPPGTEDVDVIDVIGSAVFRSLKKYKISFIPRE